MKDPLDPRVDLLVAALYGELSSEELMRFEKQLESDPVLRSEWEELRATRRLLTAWELEERVPSFVLVDAERPRETPFAAVSGPRWWEVFKRPMPAAGWAFATAAVLLAILAISQARIDFLERGIAFRFGPPSQAELQTPVRKLESEGNTGAASKEPAVTTPLGEHGPGGSVPPVSQVNGAPSQVDGTPSQMNDAPANDEWVVPRSDSLAVRLGSRSDLAAAGASMTRQEFEAYTAGMAKVIGAMQSQNEYNQRQNEEFLAFVRTMYQGISEKQSDDYYELRGRIESVRYGLTEVETTTNDRLDMIDLRSGEPLSPGVPPTNPERKENENE